MSGLCLRSTIHAAQVDLGFHSEKTGADVLPIGASNVGVCPLLRSILAGGGHRVWMEQILLDVKQGYRT